jgi:diguanylate cyclase (GGDEF)-like protein/PAS domain S-box-containing protein
MSHEEMGMINPLRIDDTRVESRATPIYESPFASAFCSHDWVIVRVARGLLRMIGISAADIVGKRIDTVFRTPELPLPNGAETTELGLFCCRRSAAPDLWLKATGSHGEQGWEVHFADVSGLVGACDELQYSETIWRHAIEAAGHGVWEYNAATDKRFYSEGWRQIRGFPSVGEVCDRLEDWASRLHPDDVGDVMEHVRAHNAGEVSRFAFEYRERRLDGRWIWILARGRAVAWDETGYPTRFIGTDLDITNLKEEEARRADELREVHERHVRQLSKAQAATEAARKVAQMLAHKDSLTGLANRRAFGEEIRDRIASGKHFAVMTIDLDRFRTINQGLGPAIGDLVIKQIGGRIERLACPGGLAARIAGDEFGLILPKPDNDLAESAADMARAIIDIVHGPVPLGDMDVEVGASIGIALFPDHGADVDMLTRHADIAMFDVKQNGRGSWRIFSDDIGRDIEGMVRLAADARRTVLDGHIEPHFQPIVDIASGKVLSFEVLARWHHPEFGPIAPDRFLPLIAQAGLMNQFTALILRRACQAALEWPDSVAIAVNVSADEVCDATLPGRILSILDSVGYPPHRLGIEITEQALVRDLATAKLVVSELREAGIRVLLDDFGTGYSGLGYLRELQFDCLKIDRSFVASLAEQQESVKIVEAIQALARSLNIVTVAEGIEDQVACDKLLELGCRVGQGWFFAKALPHPEAEKLVRRQYPAEAVSAED